MDNVIIVGNGILGLMSAYKLIKRDTGIKITLIGPDDNRGCASLAAAAMFNSFAEVDGHTLNNDVEYRKFLLNKSATPFWPSLLKEIEDDAGMKLEYGFGTFVINNYTTDSLEDENFDAIIAALKKFDQQYEMIAPSSIPKYNPSASGRAGRAVYINKEGWVNPRLLFDALHQILRNNARVNMVSGYCKSLHKENNNIAYVLLESGEKITGNTYILTPGATFTKIINASNLELNFLKIFYGVGCSVLLKTKNNTLESCIRTPNRGLACGIYASPHDSNHTLVGASNFITTEPSNHPHLTSVYTIIKSAMEQINVNFYRSELVKVNVGWRPTSEDTLPMLGKTSIGNLLVATGTKRDGLHCSPVISDYLTDLVLNNSSTQDFSFFNPERSPVRFYTREDAIKTTVRHSINAAYQHDFVPAKSKMTEALEKFYYDDLNQLHDKVGAHDWGIPPEMIDMYRYGHAK